MPVLIKSIVIVSLALLAPLAVQAQSLEELRSMSPENRRSIVEGMSVEQRSALREQRRSARREHRAAHRDLRQQRRQAARERWEAMSDEERALAREKRQERRMKRSKRHEERSHPDRGEVER